MIGMFMVGGWKWRANVIRPLVGWTDLVASESIQAIAGE